MSKKANALGQYPVPNVRKLIVPDGGFEVASVDLSGADAQTVAWESNDQDLKAAFRAKIKIHAHNAKSMFRGKVTTGFEQPYYDLCRTGVHLVNYVGGDETLAAAMGFSVWEARAFRDEWFGLHPRILDWHDRIQDQLNRTRQVSNKFGYRRFYFDRVEGILPEAIAWIGQSTTACVTYRGFSLMECWDTIQKFPEREQLFEPWMIELSRILLTELDLQMYLQVHDELVFQYPIMYREEVLKRVHPLIHITVPYDDPLIIPWGLKTSTRSWGECEGRNWPSDTMKTGSKPS